MHPILFKLGPITVYTYGFCVMLGVFAGYFVCLKQLKNTQISEPLFSQFFFWLLIISFISARVVYILTEFPLFLEHPFLIIFSRSGFVFYGGLIGAFISLFFFTKKNKIAFLQTADIFSVALPLGHAFGRIGCFFYGCCYGKTINGIIIPTQLISAGFLFFLFIVLYFLSKNKSFHGQLLITYMFYYGIFRFIIEFYRGDLRGTIFFLSTSQFIALCFILTSIFLYFILQRKTLKTS